MAILDIFIGVPQSKYAAMATLAAVLAVAVAMLMGKDSVSMGQKFVVMLVMFLFALPGLLLSLFQLTCLVTGTGSGNKNWWCGAYAWIGTIIAFLWALVIITVAVISIKRGTSFEAELAAAGAEGFSDMKAAAEAARKMADKAANEYFADAEPVPGMPTDMPPKTDAEKKAEEEAKLAMADQAAMGTDAAPPAVAADGAVSGMPAEEIVLPEGFASMPVPSPKMKTISNFYSAPAKKAAEGFYSQKTAEIAPSMPETFTSCGAPLAF